MGLSRAGQAGGSKGVRRGRRLWVGSLRCWGCLAEREDAFGWEACLWDRDDAILAESGKDCRYELKGQGSEQHGCSPAHEGDEILIQYL